MTPKDWAAQALIGSRPAVFWSDRADAPPEAPALSGRAEAGLTIIGGGFTGLWAAIQALEERPGLRVTVLESERCGFGASSRNGGFCDGSLTHGLENGLSHWPDEAETLVRMGRENLDAIDVAVDRYDIAADYRRTAEIGVATEPWHLESIEEAFELHERFGDTVALLDADAMRARVDSPTYLGGLIRHNDISLVDPARLCWGLRCAAESLGATIHEHSPATGIERNGSALEVTTPGGIIESERVLMATNAYPGPVRRPRRYVWPRTPIRVRSAGRVATSSPSTTTPS